MRSQGNVEFRPTEKQLLLETAIQLAYALDVDQSVDIVRRSAFSYYNKGTQEEFQVQVSVTRRKKEFIDPLEMEEIKCS